MGEFDVSGPARQDLRDIYDWIAQDDAAAADQVLSDLRDAIVRLAEMPGLGHVREDLADESLRVWTVHRYVVIYDPGREPMLVVRVLGGYRDIGSIFCDAAVPGPISPRARRSGSSNTGGFRSVAVA